MKYNKPNLFIKHITFSFITWIGKCLVGKALLIRFSWNFLLCKLKLTMPIPFSGFLLGILTCVKAEDWKGNIIVHQSGTSSIKIIYFNNKVLFSKLSNSPWTLSSKVASTERQQIYMPQSISIWETPNCRKL